jgi:hypothetical protein
MSETQALSNDILADGFADLSVTFESSVKEHALAAGSLIFRRTAVRILYACWLVGPVGVIIYLGLRDPDPQPETWWLAGGLMVFGLALPYIFPWLLVLSLRKGQTGIGGPHTMTLNGGGVRMLSPHTKVDLSWGGVYGARETKEFIFIHMGKNVAYFLPKRVLTPEMLSQARELLLSRLGKSARLFESDGR